MKQKYIYIILFIALFGCDNKQNIYTYTEIHKKPQINPIQQPILSSKNLPAQQRAQNPETQKMIMNSSSKVNLIWNTPADWIESTGTGIRLVTFKSNLHNPVECSIVSLEGMAGGVNANIIRWLRQINISPITDSEIQAFLNNQKNIFIKSGQSAQIIDLTYFQNKQTGSNPSIIGAVISTEERSVFIKMTGSYTDVIKEHTNLINLIESLELNNE